MESEERKKGSANNSWENTQSTLGLGLDEDEDDISSSSKENEGNIEERLEKFRDSWKREIKLKATSSENESGIVRSPINEKSSRETPCHSEDYGKEISEMERQAAELFKKGSNLESSGKLYDAVACYRRATQLVPDIESRVYFKEKTKREQRKSDAQFHEITATNFTGGNNDEEESDLEDEVNLILKFNSLNIDDDGNFFICQPAVSTRSTHFSDLPYEVVVYILRWIVSDELDMRSLEIFGQVCRGFFILSREPEIWRLACIRMWTGSIIDQCNLSLYNDDWRTVYLNKPRVNVNGTYISKASYVRQGEASFQDVNYRPCYLVEYYRYLRFFPKGIIMMLNTPDDPFQTLAKLKSKNVNYHAIVRGHYIIQDSRVSAVLKSRSTSVERVNFGKRGHKNRLIISEKEYHLLLEIRSAKKGRNNQLVWLAYTVISKKNDQHESVNTFDLSLTKFPPFWFSRVKSYGSSSMSPLM